jgi:phage shock protein PspC (stress-responsive transcriptional regulator)
VNDTTTLTPPGGASADADRKLIRPTEGRVLAGVAAGLARYFGISPVVYRVAFAALVLLGGSGFILYAAAWLVIPDERRGESVVEEAISHQRDRPWLIIGVGLVGLGLILGIAGSDGIGCRSATTRTSRRPPRSPSRGGGRRRSSRSSSRP